MTKQNKKILTHVGFEHGVSQLKRNGGEVSAISNIAQQSCHCQGRAQCDDLRIFTCCCSDDEMEVKSMP